MSKSIGEIIVRVDFNVTNDGNVAKLKQRLAEDINLCNSLAAINPSPEKDRCFNKAIEYLELASMMAVKGATTDK